MNYHSDEWIMERLNEHYQEAITIFPKDRILAIMIQGSQNYGLDYVGSDIDTKCIVLPTLEDICFNKKPTSYTHVRENNEHIDFKDVRKITEDFKKQNINFLEVLFTKYRIVFCFPIPFTQIHLLYTLYSYKIRLQCSCSNICN